MAKGQVAKDYVTKVITDAFGDNIAGIVDKKIYIWADDGGEKVQIAISMTMPKTFIGKEPIGTANTTSTSAFSSTPTEMSAEDKAKVAELMARLGVS